MITKVSTVRNKNTGQVFEVIPGSLLPDFFEEVTDDDIKVGEPKVEFEIEEAKEEKKPAAKKTSKKGAKKNGENKRK